MRQLSVDELSNLLQGPTEPERRLFKPAIFDLNEREDAEPFLFLLRSGRVQLVNDHIHLQCAELLEARSPGQKPSQTQIDALVSRLGGGERPERMGIWVHYPWSSTLVHTLAEAEFRELRLSRNRHKIMAPEQSCLSKCRIGIVGLSVGHVVAVTLALEGIGTHFRLADPDLVSLSNLNRIPATIGTLGLNKAVAAARRMYELDPFIDVEVFTEGLTETNREQFLDGGDPLDLLIEECDDLFTKVSAREHARRFAIPVVMATNDRGLLDIERFDREPDRPVMHGLLGDTESESLRGLSTENKAPFLLRVLGADMSARMAASLIEIDRTITGWPQLGSGTTFDAGAVANASRRILLGDLTDSGRFVLDLEQLIRNGASLHRRSAPATIPSQVTQARRCQSPIPSRGAASLSEDELKWLVDLAATAPSGGNSQPWVFSASADGLLCCEVNAKRATSFLDFDGGAAVAACGAALCNLEIAAAWLGLAVETTWPETPKQGRLFEARFERRPYVRTEIPLEVLRSRCTNRNLGSRVPLSDSERSQLLAVAERSRCLLQTVTDPNALEAIAAILGDVDRFRFLCPPLHEEMMSELRWTPEDVEVTGDGIDVETLGLAPSDLVGLKLVARRSVVEVLKMLGAGRRLATLSRRAVDAASAVVLLSVPGTDRHASFEGGRAFQRVWLEATMMGVAMQPMSAAPYLFARLERGHHDGFSEAEQEELASLHARYRQVFPRRNGETEVLLFRIAKAPEWVHTSRRRRLEDVLRFS